MQRISVFGLGYVGLPSAAVFADSGLQVIGVDIDAEAVDTINGGAAHIVEPGLDELLNKVVGQGVLRATTAAEPADVFVIAVPTPFKEGNQPDLRFVQSAADSIAPLLKPGNLVILESTSPVGATEQLAGWLRESRPDLAVPELDGTIGDINIAYCPERVLPGKVIEEVVSNDRIIGGLTADCSAAAVRFYKHVVKGDCHVTNSRTAELCKLSENSFRDVNIAFANELSVIAAKMGIDVYELIELTNKHPRVNILQPGTGVGGHCIAVDPWFIVASAPRESRIIRTARTVNDDKPEWVVDQVAKLTEGHDRLNISCMGLAYKPDVDDLRESPSIAAVRMMAEKDIGSLTICEPFVDAVPASLADLDVKFASMEAAVERGDIIVFLTAHSQFRSISDAALEGKQIFDACGLTNHDK